MVYVYLVLDVCLTNLLVLKSPTGRYVTDNMDNSGIMHST